jgi:hypothetical protein
MRVIFKTISYITFLLISFNVNAQTDKTNSDLEAIIATLTDYIEGSTNGQPKRLKKAFHNDLNLYYNRKGEFAAWSGKAYIEDTKEGKPTGESGRIISIDFVKDIAVAKVEISHPEKPVPYIDYFMLLKIKGQWTIIHKMFTKQSREALNELPVIAEAIMNYINGTANGEPELVKKAFHKDLNLYSIANDTLRTWNGQNYISGIKVGNKNSRVGRIVSIDYENNAAIAKAEIVIPGRRVFTDYFLLLKYNGLWKIIHKSYTSVPISKK